MCPDLLLTHFDCISDAPDAIPRLRRFVLDLAVRGKLVDQNSDDEPASALLKRIYSAVGNGRGEEKYDFDQLPQDDCPFGLPAKWAWTRLGPLCTKTGSGSTPRGGRSVYKESGVPFLRSQNVYNDGLRLGDVAYIDDQTHHKMDGTALEPGDLLLNITGGSIGRCCVVPNDMGQANISQHVAIIRLAIPAMQGYVHRLVLSPYFQSFVVGEQTGAGRGGLPKNRMDRIPVALPPLAEQQRIVAKVDKLMALCDRLEAAQREREERRESLNRASLHRLNNGADADAFRNHARFHLRHLPRLTTRPEHIRELRQTILNLAVRGKLVPQDPTDEPALILLEKKTKLPEGHQRRRKILKKQPVDQSDDFFPAIPSTWEYRDIQTLYDLNAIIDYADGNHGSLYPRSSEFGDSGATFVTAKDLVDGRVNWKSCAKLNEERAKQLTKGWARGGDVLLTHNATVGRIAQVEADAGLFLLGTSVTFYRLNPKVLSQDFFYYVLKSPLWQGQLEAIMAQTTRNQVSIQKQAFFRVVVPPLAEQHRIVAKVDELMKLCDQLESQLITIQTESRRLLEAILHEALAPAPIVPAN